MLIQGGQIMEKNIRKLLSVVLVLVMLFNMLPLNAFAVETETQPPTDNTGQEAVSRDVYIVEEIIEERTEYIKQFRMSNGLQMAAVYSSPIHYEENGRWEEIDNTLQLATTRSGNAYVNTAGVWQVSFPQNIKIIHSIGIDLLPEVSRKGTLIPFVLSKNIFLTVYGFGQLNSLLGRLSLCAADACLIVFDHYLGKCPA